MPLARVKRKLNTPQRIECVKMRAEFCTLSEIVEYLKETYKIEMTEHGVKAAVEAEKHKKVFKDFREKYYAGMKEVPIANKRIRLDNMDRAREKLMKLIEKNKCEDSSDKKELMYSISTLMDTLKRGQDEMEKKGTMIPSQGDEYSDKSDDELIARGAELLKSAEKFVRGGTSGIRSDTEETPSEDTR